MGVVTGKQGAASVGSFEPFLVHQFLPKCKDCGGSHPLARKPKMAEDTCPDCGAPASVPGEAILEEAAITGILGAVAVTFMKIGRYLRKTAKGF